MSAHLAWACLSCWIATMNDYQTYHVPSKDWKQWQLRCPIKNQQKTYSFSLSNGFVRAMVSSTLDALTQSDQVLYCRSCWLLKGLVWSTVLAAAAAWSCGSLKATRTGPLPFSHDQVPEWCANCPNCAGPKCKALFSCLFFGLGQFFLMPGMAKNLSELPLANLNAHPNRIRFGLSRLSSHGDVSCLVSAKQILWCSMFWVYSQ